MSGNWRAVTETGTTYTMHDGIVHVDSARSGIFAIKPVLMQSARDPRYKPWTYGDDETNPWSTVERPVVGERLYVAGFNEWRISTDIVSVEDLPDEPTA